MLQLKSLMRNCLLSAACRFLTTRMSKSHINIVLSSTRLRRQVDRFVNEVCAHRAQTSAKCLTSTKSYPGFESRFPDQFGFTPKMLWLHYLVGVSYCAECTQEQLLGFELLRECRMCFTQHQESVKVVYLCRMALRYFCAEIVISVCTYLYATNSGYLPRLVRLTSFRTEF